MLIKSFLNNQVKAIKSGRLSLIQQAFFGGQCSGNIPPKSKNFMDLESKYGCHNYHPLPVVLERGEGIYVWDVDGRRYMDFLSAYSACNQGHVHPKILKTFIEEATKLTLSSRAFYSKNLGLAEKYLCELFKYDKVLFMNTGCEGVESAVKFARRWAYNVKKVPENQARVLFANGNFWGRSIAACGSSDDPDRFYRFGPFTGLNFDLIEFNDIAALKEAFEKNPNYAAFVVEPIQGERGVVIPSDGYLQEVQRLCKQHKVLFVTDEIQTGLGRTGQLLCHYHDQVRPDMVVLGKALAGGFYPVSALLADDEVMLQIKPGEHGSTYGGNPLGTATAIKAIEVLLEEKMIENSQNMGKVLLNGLSSYKKDYIKEVRGRGLFCAVEFREGTKYKAWDMCVALKNYGIIAKPTHDTTIRFSPPLVINQSQIEETIEAVGKAFKDLEAKK